MTSHKCFATNSLRLPIALAAILFFGCDENRLATKPATSDSSPIAAGAKSTAATKEARTAKAGPPKLDRSVVDKHKQLYDMSCIPMTVEMVLKLTKHAPQDYFQQQTTWGNNRFGNFSDFDGKTLMGLTFHKQFGLPRDDDFPIDRLFSTIDKELEAGHFVIVSLPSNSGWHMYVIYGKDRDGDFRAVSKYGTQKDGAVTIEQEHVKQIIKRVHGTDILTYEESPKS